MSRDLKILNEIMGLNNFPKLTKRQRDYSTLIHASTKSLVSLIDDGIDLGAMIEIEALPFQHDAHDICGVSA